jgi:[amino group carrier protein]-lysine/ornithine hydrolase
VTLQDVRDVELLSQAVRIPSPSGREARLAAFLSTAMAERGMRGRIDEAGNVIGITGTGRTPTVMLVSHLDTVDDPIPFRRTREAIFGRGTVDAKGSLVAMIAAASRRRSFPGRLVVVGVVEEETAGSRGAVHLRTTWHAPDAVVIGEPSGWSNVVLGYKGKLDLRYVVCKPPTHPSNPAQKASEIAAAFWHEALDVIGPDASHARFDRPAVTLCGISGDIARAVAEISYRTPPGFDTERLVAALSARAGGGRLDVVNDVAAVRADRRDPVARALSAGIRLVGGTPTPKVKTATSDMNTLAEVWTMPMAAYGPGNSDLDHSADEHILVDEFRRGVEVLATAIDELS